MASISPGEYITYFDSSDIPSTLAAWTLTSPNATVYGPTVTTLGNVSFVPGAVSVATPVVFIGLDGNKWTPTIANTGEVSATSGSALSASDTIAALTDSNGVAWVFYVDDTNIVQVTTAAVLPSLLRYPALIFTYTPESGSDRCLLHSARQSLTPRRRSA